MTGIGIPIRSRRRRGGQMVIVVVGDEGDGRFPSAERLAMIASICSGRSGPVLTTATSACPTKYVLVPVTLFWRRVRASNRATSGVSRSNSPAFIRRIVSLSDSATRCFTCVVGSSRHHGAGSANIPAVAVASGLSRSGWVCSEQR